ncbi:IKI3 family-domain-containing protein [Umbelopsis sp. AD052]|nr:IKI3 family-domain-containing protein [Umbelopsis sp. AD052]
MRNLQLLEQCKSRLSFQDLSQSKAFTAVDPDSGDVYAAWFTDDTVKVALRDQHSDFANDFVELCRLPAFERNDCGNVIIDLLYLPDAQAACLCLNTGDIALISKERFNAGGEALEIVGTVDSGILSMSWSPDQEVVVVITGIVLGASTVLEMTRDFDTITEFPLDTNEEGEGVSHSVGWGKKETQFHGSEGKAAAQKKADINTYTTSPDDDQQPKISWRGDGSFYVVSSVDPSKDSRVLRVYNREGVLQNTSEPVDKLEHVLNWRPSGNLIASTQRLPHRHDIVFFERNGLRHGEFTLRETSEHKVIELQWNADSSILAVWLQTQQNDTIKKTVQLWTMNNYHWYMKQHLDLGSNIVAFNWDVENPYVAHILAEDAFYHQFVFIHDIATSTSTSKDNAGYVAVIDGANALMTPFLYQNVPPPMSSMVVTADENIQEIAYSNFSTGTQIAVLGVSRKVVFYELPEKACGATVTLGSIQLSITDGSLPRQIKWVNQTTIAYLQYSDEDHQDYLFVDEIDMKGDILKESKLAVGGRGLRLYSNALSGSLLVERNDGDILEAILDTDTIELQPLLSLPSAAPWIGAITIQTESSEVKTIIAALTDRGKLYVDAQLVSSECTSFFLRHNFLVYTTTNHVVRFLPLDTPFSDTQEVEKIATAYDETTRRVERGARIVVAIQDAPKLVLQMPRGNLETVCPRAFVLSNIRDAIKKIDYRSAFLACRTNRIDLNILYDEDPQLFNDNVDTLLSQVHEVDYINLFLSNLRNEDVTVTMYPKVGTVPEASAATPSTSSLENKVNTICEKVRTVLIQRDQKKYIQAILSTYVRSTPSDLESALRLLAELKATDIGHAEEALSYTIFLCDADRLFDVALGMYDFSLVLMVAQQSQKDPREYLPFLQELQSLEKFYQRFKIDDHLKRYRKAVHNLSKAGNDHFDQLVNYTKLHSLYTYALSLYPNATNERKTLLVAYAEYLQGRTSYDEAAIAYTMAGSLQDALDAYSLGLSWREAFSVAKELDYSDSAMADLGYGLIESLKEKRRFQEAAQIALDYSKDVEDAVDSLIKGNLWNESIRISRTYNRTDLVETHIKPGIAETYSQHRDDIKEMEEQFEKQTSRLRELRQKKPDPFMNMPDDPTLENVDMFSDTTSMYSQFTRNTATTARFSQASSSTARSGRTSKTKRREERKKARGKKGTIYEEEYIVGSLKRLYERASGMQAEIGGMIKTLMVFGHIDDAKVIQKQFSSLITQLRSGIDEIFVPLQLQHPPNDEGIVPPPTVIEKPTMTNVEWTLEILLE